MNGAVGPLAVASAPPRPGVWVETSTWPPLEVHEVVGWRVGFSGGFTRRGNSAVPRRVSVGTRTLADGLARVEDFYAARSVPTVVRVNPQVAPELDALLADRGYRPHAPTVVMVAPTAGAPAARAPRREAGEQAGPGVEITVTDEPDGTWLDAWLGGKATATEDRDLAARLVQGASARYLTARDRAGVVGVLRAAPTGRWVGLSCLVVTARARRRGIGRHLTRTALDEARAPWAFLQVEEANHAARALYASLDFVVADRYHYRQR